MHNSTRRNNNTIMERFHIEIKLLSITNNIIKKVFADECGCVNYAYSGHTLENYNTTSYSRINKMYNDCNKNVRPVCSVRYVTYTFN